LPADPQPAPADLAIGNAPQVRAEQPAHGAKDILHSVEADAADEMHVMRDFAHLGFPF